MPDSLHGWLGSCYVTVSQCHLLYLPCIWGQRPCCKGPRAVPPWSDAASEVTPSCTPLPLSSRLPMGGKSGLRAAPNTKNDPAPRASSAKAEEPLARSWRYLAQ